MKQHARISPSVRIVLSVAAVLAVSLFGGWIVRGQVSTVRGVDLSVSMDAPRSMTRGEPVHYFFVVKNTGTEAEPSVTFSDPLQGSFVLTGMENVTCRQTQRLITCDSFALPAGASRTIRLTFTVPLGGERCVKQTVTHQATVRGSLENQAYTNNNVTASVRSDVLCEQSKSVVSSSSAVSSAPTSSRVSSSSLSRSSAVSSRTSSIPISSRSTSAAALVDHSVTMNAPTDIIRGIPADIYFTLVNSGIQADQSVRLSYAMQGSYTLTGAENATCRLTSGIVNCEAFAIEAQSSRRVRLTVLVPETTACETKVVSQQARVVGSLEAESLLQNNTTPVTRSTVNCGRPSASSSSVSTQPQIADYSIRNASDTALTSDGKFTLRVNAVNNSAVAVENATISIGLLSDYQQTWNYESYSVISGQHDARCTRAANSGIIWCRGIRLAPNSQQTLSISIQTNLSKLRCGDRIGVIAHMTAPVTDVSAGDNYLQGDKTITASCNEPDSSLRLAGPNNATRLDVKMLKTVIIVASVSPSARPILHGQYPGLFTCSPMTEYPDGKMRWYCRAAYNVQQFSLELYYSLPGNPLIRSNSVDVRVVY